MFVAGLGTGPMVLSPLSEVRCQHAVDTWTHMAAETILLTHAAVLWETPHLHWLLHLLPHLDDPLRSGKKHPDHADRAFPRWLGWLSLPLRSRGNSGRHVCETR